MAARMDRPREMRRPLKPVTDESLLSNDKGYAVAFADVTRVRDGDMQLTFDLKLSSRELPLALDETWAEP